MRIVPCLEPFRRVSFSIFPNVRYTGHACLSPWKRVNLVLSDARIMGAIVAPGGSFSYCQSTSAISDGTKHYILRDSEENAHLCVPPPIPCPHLIVNPSLALFVKKLQLGFIPKLLSKQRIPDEFANALNRVSSPQFNLLRYMLPINTNLIPCDFEDITGPLWTPREPLNLLQQCLRVLETQLPPELCASL